MDRFWNNPVRIVQNNLRAIDALNLDVAALIKQHIEYGCNALVVNAGGLLSWYDSEVSGQPHNPFLSEDYVGKVMEEARRNGLKVLLRMDVSNLSEAEAKEHPDWIRRDVNGNAAYDLGMIQSCFNSPKWNEYNLEVLDELLSKYRPDGIFYNAVHYGFCHCETCKQKYFNDTGRTLPDTLNSGTEEGRSFMLYRNKQAIERFSKIHEFIHDRLPDAVLAPVSSLTSDFPEFNCFSGWDTVPFSKEGQDIQVSEAANNVMRKQPKYIYLAGENALLANVMNKPNMICLHYSAQLGRRASQPAAQLTYDMMQSSAFGAGLCLNVIGTFDLDDRRSLPVIKSTFNYLKTNEKYYNAIKNSADIGIIYSKASIDFADGRDRKETCMADILSEGYTSPHLNEYRGVYESLVQRHIPFDVLHDGFLLDAELSRYHTLFLPGVTCMSDEQAKKLDSYVNNGGNLIITGRLPGTQDEFGRPRELSALACFLYDVLSEDPVGGYLIFGSKEQFPSFESIDRIGIAGKFANLKPKSGAVTFLRELNREPQAKCHKPEFSYVEELTDDYGLFCTGFGKGKVVVLPWDCGSLQRQYGIAEIDMLISDLLHWLNWKETVTTNAPYSVQLISSKCPEGRLIHLINGTGLQSKPQLEVVPLPNITVSYRCTDNSAISIKSGEILTSVRSGEFLEVSIPVLNEFECILLS